MTYYLFKEDVFKEHSRIDIIGSLKRFDLVVYLTTQIAVDAYVVTGELHLFIKLLQTSL
jgi:hypothetical protein